MIARRRRAVGLIVATLAAAPAATMAQQAVPIASVTVAPIDRIDAAMTRAGVPGTGDRLTGLMGSVGIVPAAQIDRATPTAITFVFGENVTQQNSAIIALPVRVGAVPISTFAANGQPIAGHADALTMGGFTFRRTDAHLIFGGQQQVVLDSTTASLSAPVRDESVLARVDVDVRKAREIAPQRFEAFIQQAATSGGTPPPNSQQTATYDAGREAGARAAADFFRSLDSISIALGTDAKSAPSLVAPPAATPTPSGANFLLAPEGENATLDVAFSPFALKPAEAGGFAKPAFPEASVARLDYAYPSAEATPAILSMLSSFIDSSSAPNATPEQSRELFAALADVMVGDAVSFAVAPGEGTSSVVYGVIQRREPKPLAASMERLESAAKVIDGDQAPSWKRSTYEDAGRTVIRIDLLEQGSRVSSIDLVESDGRVLMAIAKDEGRHLAALASLPAAGGEPIANLVEIDADLPKLGQAIQALPAGTVGAGTLRRLEQLTTAGHLRIIAGPDANGFKLRASMPLSMIGTLFNLQ